MKQIVLVLAAAALMLSTTMTSCKKKSQDTVTPAKGDKGDKGDKGETGASSKDTLVIHDTMGTHIYSPDMFVVSEVSWIKGDSAKGQNYYYVEVHYAGLTDHAVDHGMVELYYLDGNKTWTPVQNLTLGHTVFSYHFFVGGLDVFVQGDNETMPTTAPRTIVLRLVVIDGQQKTAPKPFPATPKEVSQASIMLQPQQSVTTQLN